MVINSIKTVVYERTYYPNGISHHYLPLYNLECLINDIISLNQTTNYIKFNIFFISSKTGYVEFENNMCYIKCKDDVDEFNKKIFIEKCKDDSELYEIAEKHYMLCDIKDINSFQNALKSYIFYIYETLPMLIDILKKDYNINDIDLSYGYFGFEVNSD